jgi:hypothetical protein
VEVRLRNPVALFALLMMVVAAGAETPWPLRTPAEIKALHGADFTGMHVFTYRHTSTPAKPNTSPETIIGIGKHLIYRADGADRMVVDLRFGRVYWFQGGNRYINVSIAPFVAWGEFELANRVQLKKILSAAVDEAKARVMYDPFWTPAEMKVVAPGEDMPALKKREQDGTQIFNYDDVEVMHWRPMPAALPEPFSANLRRAFLWFFESHPVLLTMVAGENRLPQYWMLRKKRVGDLHTDEYTLADARWCATCEAFPSDAEVVLGFRGVFQERIAPVMIAAAQGKFAATSTEEYLRRIDTAARQGVMLEATLWLLEMGLQEPARPCQPSDASAYCDVTRRVVPQLRADAEVQTLIKGLQARSVENSNAIAALREKVRSNAYYIDLASANALPDSAFRSKAGDSAELKFLEALKAMPMVPAVYRDIGNMYYTGMNFWQAWLVWELGRAVKGRSSEPTIWQRFDRMEAEARRRHPEFY